MGKYILKRLLETIPVLFIITIVVFFLVRVSGDPVNTMLPPDAPPEAKEELREALGLNKPMIEQYGIFLSDLAHGRFGTSLRYGQEAGEVVMEKLPATLQLATISLIVSMVLGIVLGVLCATFKDKPLDVFFNSLSVVGQAMPSFWIGIMLILLFGVTLHWLPVSGRGGWQNLVLPVATLSIVTSAQIVPLVRSSMLEIMHEDYIRTAKSKGLRERVIIYRHAFKNALIPVVTIMALQVPNLVGGSLITETVFAWPGLGQLLIQCINGRDMCVVQACVVFISLITILANLAADVLYAVIDPRIRY
ncbi:MAG: ABC transporter permease [Oscillospiraceae bacterium]